MVDSEDDRTAYHEAGHAVVGFAMGGRIERIQLGGESDENLPESFGDCLINWGRGSSQCDWHTQRELMTILAGPVAEMIYIGERLHPAVYGPWRHDWEQALLRVGQFSSGQTAVALLEQLIVELHDKMSADRCWAAIAAVADQLLAHEYLEHEQLEDALNFWLR